MNNYKVVLYNKQTNKVIKYVVTKIIPLVDNRYKGLKNTHKVLIHVKNKEDKKYTIKNRGYINITAKCYLNSIMSSKSDYEIISKNF